MDYAFYFSLLLVIGLIIAFNIIIFVIVIYRLTCGRKTSSRNPDKLLVRVRRAVAILTLLGLTWTFGLLSLIHQASSFTFQVLFCIFNSLQGLFIFVMLCILPEEVQKVWKKWIVSCPLPKFDTFLTYVKIISNRIVSNWDRHLTYILTQI